MAETDFYHKHTLDQLQAELDGAEEASRRLAARVERLGQEIRRRLDARAAESAGETVQ